MKKIILAAAIALAAACRRTIMPEATPVVNTEIKNTSGQTILAGHASLSVFEWPAYKGWFDQSFNNYAVDMATAQELKPLLEKKHVEIFLGSWCGDSKREVPRLIKILEQAGMDTARLALIFVDNSISTYKQSPQHEEAGLNIHHVPTIIVYEGKKEMGRIVETPVHSLEKDLLDILTRKPYQHTYQAIEYWRSKVPGRTARMSDASLQGLAAILKPMCKYAGEFNAYGYVQLAAGNAVEAINVFRLNTLLYPDNASLFDSLGDGLAKTGDKPGAIAAYRKVLMLRPGDVNAARQIEKLSE